MPDVFLKQFPIGLFQPVHILHSESARPRGIKVLPSPLLSRNFWMVPWLCHIKLMSFVRTNLTCPTRKFNFSKCWASNSMDRVPPCGGSSVTGASQFYRHSADGPASLSYTFFPTSLLIRPSHGLTQLRCVLSTGIKSSGAKAETSGGVPHPPPSLGVVHLCPFLRGSLMHVITITATEVQEA